MNSFSLDDDSVDLVALFGYKEKLNGLRKKIGKFVRKECEGKTHSVNFHFEEIVVLSSLLKNEIGKAGDEIKNREANIQKKKEEMRKSSNVMTMKYFDTSDDEDTSTSEDDEPPSATKFFEKELAAFENSGVSSMGSQNWGDVFDGGGGGGKRGEEEEETSDDDNSEDEGEEGSFPFTRREFQKTEANKITPKCIKKGILIFDPEDLERIIQRGGGEEAPKSPIPNSNFVGEGSFGKVFRSWMRNKGRIEDIVIKKVEILGSMDSKVVQSEIVILSVCQHPNIAEIIGFGISQTHAYVVMNFYDEIDVPMMKQMTFSEKLKILLDTAKGGEYLHSNNIIHRDLKWGNVMRSSFDHNAKILDFGISKIGGSNKTMVGTPEMVPPEIVLGGGKVEYTSKVDIFTFGIMTWQLMRSNIRPYGKKKDPRIMFRVAKDGKRPRTEGLDFGCEELKELMIECWDEDPPNRPTFTKIVRRLERMMKDYD